MQIFSFHDLTKPYETAVSKHTRAHTQTIMYFPFNNRVESRKEI